MGQYFKDMYQFNYEAVDLTSYTKKFLQFSTDRHLLHGYLMRVLLVDNNFQAAHDAAKKFIDENWEKLSPTKMPVEILV